ncbi:AprI/Inh family metalloprotease inhibitor [uncultured Cohaesibacter sp.]|uniref:AprI/Inh family metalloprotease inhibitor n=1 Tax=uncultured Cohaesibacter sp. TaxID=1002546 RepID=UPI00292E4DDE|nr:AprI/Inh family metalloprotease inhibitor [uncultured Cohaesibacter sp.]
MIRNCALVGICLLLSGCATGGFGQFGGNNASSVNPAPTTPVESQQLGALIPNDQYPNQSYPMVGNSGQPINNAMGAEAELASPTYGDANTQEASVPAAARELKRTDLLGAWTLTSGASQCKLNVNLTNWTGGYRASSRGCNDSDLQRINAWRLDADKLVVFLAEDGVSVIARFYSDMPGRFNGQAALDGRALSFFR